MSPTVTPVFDHVSTPDYQTLTAWTEIREQDDEPWIEAGLKKIAGFLHLKQNWDSYGSGPVRREAAQAAGNLLALTWRFLGTGSDPSIVAIGGGGIQVTFLTASRALEIEILPNGDAIALKLEEDEPVGDDEPLRLTRPDVEEMLGWL